MIKTLLSGIAVALMFVIPQGFAEEQDDGPEMLGFYHFYAPDPAAVVAAMDKFWASDCGKEYPAEVALSAEVFNGGYPSSHFVLNTFPNAAAQEKAASILMGCPDGRTFLKDLQAAGVKPTTQYLGFHAAEGGNWREDTAFAKFDIVVEGQNQGLYVAAWKKMMAGVLEDIDVSSYGIGAVVFGNDKFSHWVYVSAKNSTELAATQQALLTHPDFQTFLKEAGGLRTNVNTTLVQILKGYSHD